MIFRPQRASKPGGPARRAGAFTLIEVILAILIAVGLLVVALYFYSQAADLRARLLQESDQLASIRLCLDRLTADLRAAFAQPQIGFTGDESSLHFVVAGLPLRAPMSAAAWSSAGRLESDLRLVSYSCGRALQGTNAIMTGVIRSETSLLDTSATFAPTNAPSASDRMANLSSPALSASASAASPPPWIDTVHFLQLAYWDGSGWADHWDSPDLPACVEVRLGVEPLPEGTDPLDYPYEIFRRAIYLPASRGSDLELELLGRADREPSRGVASR